MRMVFFLSCAFLFALSAESQIKWVPYTGKLPANVVFGGQENGVKLAICRCNYNGGAHSGKLFKSGNSYICNIGYGGKEISLTKFKVLVANFGNTTNAKNTNATATSTATSRSGCGNPVGKWAMAGGYLVLTAEGQMKSINGKVNGNWQCGGQNVRLAYTNGTAYVLTPNGNGTYSARPEKGGDSFEARPMTKDEMEMVKTMNQVDDVMNKVFKKKN